jgi:transcription elongation factor Elf1
VEGPNSGGAVMVEEQQVPRDMRFCPYCFQQEFDVTGNEKGTVYCEICGIKVDVKDLTK